MRLPDEILIRGPTRGVGTLRERKVGGVPCLAVSAWAAHEEALAATRTIREHWGHARVTREPRPAWAGGCPGDGMWIVWVPTEEWRPRSRQEPPTPVPTARLPDALLLRDVWADGSPRQRVYDGRSYEGASVWLDEDSARTAAEAIRSVGGLARVTREPLPARARARNTPRRDRWMWVVWSAEKPACAGQNLEVAP